MQATKLTAAWAMAAALVLLAGCAGQTRVESNLHIKGAPDWVNKGPAVIKNKKGRLFHGVGSAPPMGDRSLQTDTADNRARAGGKGETMPEQDITRQIDSISRVNLAGSRIIGRWRDKKTNVVYSLAELDLKQVRKTLDGVKDMNEGFRNHMATHGENIFDRMAAGGE